MNYILCPLYSGLLNVSKIHKIHYATYGNPNGIPLLCFHGGPGGGFKDKYTAMTDMNKYYTIIFEQRGCGDSVPCAEIADNTCLDAVNDAELLLEYLNVKRCVVMGFSYGSTLALAFAIKNPTKTIGVFVSSIFIPLKFNDWFYGGGVKSLVPQAYENFISVIKTTDPKELFYEYDTASVNRKKEIAAALVTWELELFKGLKPIIACSEEDVDDRLLANKRIFLYYTANDFFGIGPWIKENVLKIGKIPMHIVHGQLDYVSPVTVAHQITEILPNVTLTIMPQEGHVGSVITTRLYTEINSAKVV